MNNSKSTIAILTFHRAVNYGAVLQVYALQKKITDLGAESIILDYRNDILESRHKLMTLSDCKSVKDCIRFIILSKHHNKKSIAFKDFRERYLKLSLPYNDISELSNTNYIYDKFITGSDQVWNCNITNTDPAYFLDFVKDSNKKNSYAASFGFKKIPKGKDQQYCQMLQKYNHMSVRENQGAEIVKKLTNKDVDVVLDPTLLLSKEEWFEIAKDHDKHENYILVYGFGGSKNIIEFAKNLSKKTGCKIIQISNPYFKKVGITYKRSPHPEEFLGLFKNAKFVVTNSFHGTAFSINFNKQFFTELLPESQKVNSRLEDILDLFKLRDRQILNTDVSLSDVPIEYNKVNIILEEKRKQSILYLKKIVL